MSAFVFFNKATYQTYVVQVDHIAAFIENLDEHTTFETFSEKSLTAQIDILLTSGIMDTLQ